MTNYPEMTLSQIREEEFAENEPVNHWNDCTPAEKGQRVTAFIIEQIAHSEPGALRGLAIEWLVDMVLAGATVQSIDTTDTVFARYLEDKWV